MSATGHTFVTVYGQFSRPPVGTSRCPLTVEDFTFDHVPSLPRDVIAHLATSTWIAKADNVILLGPPGVGKTHLAIALGIKAAHNAYPVLFDTTTGWVTRLEVPPEP